MSFNAPYPWWHTENDHQLSQLAAERYEIERAMREIDEQRRQERRAERRRRNRRYLRVVFGRFA